MNETNISTTTTTSTNASSSQGNQSFSKYNREQPQDKKKNIPISYISSTNSAVTTTTTSPKLASITLPLLNGLSHHPTKCCALVEEALLNYHACFILKRFFDRIASTKNPSSSRKQQSSSQSLMTKENKWTDDNANKIKFHWLFQCLSNPSLHLRRRASDVILKGLQLLFTTTSTTTTSPPSSSSSPGTKKKHEYLSILRNVLFDLIEENILPIESYAGTKDYFSTCMVSTMSGSDVLLQMFGLFHYFICDYNGGSFLEKSKSSSASPTNTSTTATTASSTTTTTSKSKVGCGKEKKDELIWCRESFVGNGGIRWICASLVRLINQLSELRARQQLLDTIVNETIQTRIFLFVDLLYRLVSTKSKTIHTLFWQSNLSSINVCGIPWTPLTTAIATMEILQKGKILPSKVRGMERSLVLLEKLVDPCLKNLCAEEVSGGPGSSRKKRKKKSQAEAVVQLVKKRRMEAGSRSHIASRGLLQDIRSRSGFLFGSAAGTSAISAREMEDDDDEDDEMISDDDDEDDVVINSDSDDDVGCDEDEEDDDDDDDEIEDEDHDDDCGEDMIVCEEEEEEEFGSCCEDIEHEHDDFLRAAVSTSHDHDEDMFAPNVCENNFMPSSSGVHDDDSLGNDELAQILADGDALDQNASSSIDLLSPSAAQPAQPPARAPASTAHRSTQPVTQNLKSKSSSPLISPTTLNERKEIFLRSGMRVLESQHRYYMSLSPEDSSKNSLLSPPSPVKREASTNLEKNDTLLNKEGAAYIFFPILTVEGERSLCKSLCNVVQPPPKPLNLKIFLRRAPTQEEFFRGSLTKNPIALTALNSAANNGGNSAATSGATSSNANEATFSTLRQHIANDLQMADSSELLELLVAGKIIDINLPIRVVQQVVWRKHVIENSHSSLNELSIPPPGVIYAGYNDDTDISHLPPMVATYRLAGVDGEATEDKVEVGDITDPEASDAANDDPEKEFEITKFIAERKGLSFLLRSIERDIGDILRRIRRDDVSFISSRKKKRKNSSREEFLKASAPPGLILLRLCARLKVNRQKLVLARAPSLLLRLLLDVLNAFDSPQQEQSVSSDTTSSEKVVSNPTSEALQELIEVLASEISVETPSTETIQSKIAAHFKSISAGATSFDERNDMELEDATLPLLFSSLREASLSAHLRKVIANLLPFLTYGQESLSRALASQYLLHVDLDLLSTEEDLTSSNHSPKSIIMDTLIEAAINLPSAKVCYAFRSELLSQGFVDKVVKFVLFDLPLEPPPWSQALWPKPSVPNKQSSLDDKKSQTLQKQWRCYLLRPNLRIGFQILIGLCTRHLSTQNFVASSMLKCCHWIESTSDASAGIELKGLGLFAETLLDTLKEDNENVSSEIVALRKKTRERKKEIAEERRSRALVGMSAFGPLTGVTPSSSAFKVSSIAVESNTSASLNSIANANSDNVPPAADASSSSATSAASALASMLGISLAALASSGQRIAAAAAGINITPSTNSDNNPQSNENNSIKTKPDQQQQSKPSWMDEMDALEDDEGLTCAVCQEGSGLQPKELLGLYAYVKKVSIPHNKGGARSFIDGSQLLFSLPPSLPKSLVGSDIDKRFFRPAKEICSALQLSSPSIMSSLTSTSAFSSSSRPSHFVTSVTAGNAIHFSCHARARMADRNHPKAPKSEWEGASLRNSRVTCNVIVPLVSSKSSQVPLVAVEGALADHQSIISNMLGARPKSMLWTVLHDARFLLLRIAYDEQLNADCGGGSVTSNLGLVFHLLFMVDMFAKDAEHDSPASAQHVKNISLAYLAACEIIDAPDSPKTDTQSLLRGLSEASVMAGICSILFHNHGQQSDGSDAEGEESSDRHQQPQWKAYRDQFLKGFIRYAGRRFAAGVEDSGCVSKRSLTGKRSRACSFGEWEILESGAASSSSINDNNNSSDNNYAAGSNMSSASARINREKMILSNVEKYSSALRPLFTLFAVLDQLSKEYINRGIMDDVSIADSAETLSDVVKCCKITSTVQDLFKKYVAGNTSMTLEQVVEEFDRGRKLA